MNLSLQADSAAATAEVAADLGTNSNPRVLVSIPSGFQLRQFVHSGVLDLLLKRGFQALIVSPNGIGEGFAEQIHKRGVEVCPINLKNQGPLSWRYWLARHQILLNGQPTETMRQAMVDFRKRHLGLALVADTCNGLMRLFPGLRKKALQWEYLLLRRADLEKLLSTKPVDLILLGSPGFMEQDALLLHAGVRRGIPVAAAIMSWDNLSSKGLINPHPDRLLVWSDYMKGEAVELQGFSAERVVETGAPLYDIFANAGRFGTRRENLEGLGLDPERRLIFYGTNHAAFFPDEIEVVKRVAQWVEEDSLGQSCQLVIRLHPQAITGPYKLQTDPYLSLASKRVKVEFPPVRNSSLPWELPKSDIEHLVRLLRDADVVINTASTISIDAAVLDRPVVCIAYDPAGDLPYEKSVRRYYDFTHMANVVRAGAAQLATSPEGLREKLVNYLEKPDLDRPGRQRIVKQQFGRVDGLSAARLVEQAAALISKGKTK
jgi:CDP-Glycerol:Poly(glycerophosphate) glycerophosphotransferase